MPSQSVKLTNVATVRLTVNGKRFEVACYKNKVLDYRAGLEKDLTEVLQTSNIHVFTSVAKGQFAAASDLQQAFGSSADNDNATMTQEEIAVQILQRGKSLQVSEGERALLYESCLTQIATQIAVNCIHPETAKPYTVTQIKHALTQQHHNSSSDTNAQAGAAAGAGDAVSSKTAGKKGKKAKQQNNNKQNSVSQQQQQHLSFTVQPHKPIKQQYLQALKYLQAAEILPIQRACMELQWQYDAVYEEAVLKALEQLEITSTSTTSTAAAATTTTQQQAYDSADTTLASSSSCTNTRTFTVDPSVYRPLQELAVSTVPGGRLEILRQQVFQAGGGTTASASAANATTAKYIKAANTKTDGKAVVEQDLSESSQEEKESGSSDSDDFLALRKKSNKAKKKQQKKARRRAQHDDDDNSSDSEKNDESAAVVTKAHHAPTAAAVVKEAVVVPTNENANSSESPASAATDSKNSTNEREAAETKKALFTCNTCVGASNSFATQSDYRAHFRSDWHRFNQKLKLMQGGAISLQEFEQCDSESFFASAANLDN